MSSLRKPATDKLKRDYTALSTLCQKQCRSDYRKNRGPLTQMGSGREKGCVKDIIGEEETFRLNMEDEKYKKLVNLLIAITPLNMEDEKYKKLVNLLIAITQSEPNQQNLHF